MFDFFKKILAAPDNSKLMEAINEGAFLVDVRSQNEFASGSAHGAVNIPLGRIAAELPKFRAKSAIVVFCRSGNRSRQAMRILEQNGIREVINGGTWQNVQHCIRSSSQPLAVSPPYKDATNTLKTTKKRRNQSQANH